MVPQLGMRPTPARELNPALDDAAIVQILVETPAGIANAAEIAAVDGVDMIAIGANDFTADIGAPRRYDDPGWPRRSRPSRRPAASTTSC
jgi:2-keto-3-deoxy-L-rhamnonate aldolase RhmA